MILNVLKAAREQVAKAGAGETADQTKRVDGALGGSGGGSPDVFTGGFAPAFVKSIGAHIVQVPMLFGKRQIKEVLGVGEIPAQGVAKDGVHVSINLGDKKSFQHVSPELKNYMLNIKREIHNAFIQQQLLVWKHKMPMSVLETPYFKHVVEPMLKAFTISDFATWVPTLNTAFYFEELELPPDLSAYFPEYQMPSRTANVPGATARMVAKLQIDNDTFNAQYNTSSNYSMTAQDCVAHTNISEDLMEDLVPQAGGFERLRKEVALAVSRAKEQAIINGDDTITSTVQGDGHMDSDIAGGAATLFQKAFKGLRKRALAAGATYDNGGQGVSLNTYNGMLSKMGKFAIDKGDLLIVVGPTVANKAVFGNVPEMLTMHNVGGLATLITGKLPPIFGIEQYPSEWVREDVNSSGVYASSQSLTTILACRKSRFVVGKRAPIRIWATPSLANQDMMLLSAKERFTFAGVPQAASEISVAIATDVALT